MALSVKVRWMIAFVVAFALQFGLRTLVGGFISFLVTTYITMAFTTIVYKFRHILVKWNERIKKHNEKLIDPWESDPWNNRITTNNDETTNIMTTSTTTSSSSSKHQSLVPTSDYEDDDDDDDDDDYDIDDSFNDRNGVHSNKQIIQHNNNSNGHNNINTIGPDSDISMHDEETPRQIPLTRIHYLDNVKSLLVLLGITHNVACSFGGTDGDKYLVIGQYECIFNYIMESITFVIGSFITPCFFFIAAYFTVLCYRRKTIEKFYRDRSKRIWIPAMIVSFTTAPATNMIAEYISNYNVVYIPAPGHCWFLFWILILDFVYCTLREEWDNDIENDDNNNNKNNSNEYDRLYYGERGPVRWYHVLHDMHDFPGPAKRVFYGSLVGGVCMVIFFFALNGHYFFTMPISIGSLSLNILMYGAGIAAAENDWLDSPDIASKMTFPVPLFRMFVLFECIEIIALLFSAKAKPIFGFLFFLVSGVFCLDMSLFIIQFMQRYFPDRNVISAYMADTSYTVYIIHPLIINVATAIFIKIYNSLYGGEYTIVFDRHQEYISKTKLAGPFDGSVHLCIGWIIVNIITHAICWPLAGFLKSKFPFLQGILFNVKVKDNFNQRVTAYSSKNNIPSRDYFSTKDLYSNPIYLKPKTREIT